MKCPSCGGEFSSQSIACPYCGRENSEGIVFQKRIYQKIEKNKLLKRFLIKQKTPELVQRMLTRLLLIITGVNLTLFAFIVILVLLTEIEVKSDIQPGKYAKVYQTNFEELDDYYFERYHWRMREFMEVVDNGEIPEHVDIDYLVEYAHRALKESQDESIFEDVYLHETSFFRGFLKLTEEESLFLEPEEDGEYEYLLRNDERRIRAVEAIERNLKEGAVK